MPAIKITNQATSTNALANNTFRTIGRPSLLTLYASCVTATDSISLSVGTKQIVVNANPNIESSADVVDTDRDMILFREPVPMGDIFLPITATTAVNFILRIEEVA